MNVDPFSLLVPADCCRPLDEGELTSEDAEATAALFKALGDPARVRIVNLLARQPESVCVCELTPAIGLSQPTVSHHLKKLVQAGCSSASSAVSGPTTASTAKASSARRASSI